MAPSRPEDAHRLFAEAFKSGDLDSLVALYEPGARYVQQSGEILVGLEAIQEALKGLLTVKGKLTAETKYAVQAGDIALLRARWHLSGTAPDGKPVELEANSTEVVRRQPDGRWLYVIDHPFGAD